MDRFMTVFSKYRFLYFFFPSLSTRKRDLWLMTIKTIFCRVRVKKTHVCVCVHMYIHARLWYTGNLETARFIESDIFLTSLCKTYNTDYAC